MHLPEPIAALVGSKPYTCDDIGKSGSKVLCYEDMVLKIEPENPDFFENIAMLRWLRGKIPVPEVLWAMTEDGFQYLLMSRVRGRMACDGAYTADPDALAQLLADALKTLWDVDITDCPRHHRLSEDLAEAKTRIARNLVDIDDVQPDTFGPGGFENPQALLAWLEDHQPPLEPVLSHGDFCLPNVFFEDGRLSGFIDLGGCGVSDKWRDIALCYRSLRDNISGHYAACPQPDFDPNILFEKLGLAPNWEKIRYYILLDELF